jgi:glycosyltransferase involved in cell wall biosynthesis
MNVLQVHYHKGFHGGAEEVVIQLDKYFKSKGITSRCVMEHNPWKIYQWTQELMRWADIVIMHNFPATLATLPNLHKKPLLWICNEPPEVFTNWWRKPIEALNRWWVRKSGMEIVVADQMGAHRIFRLYGIEPKVLPYGVDYEFWSKGVESKENGFTILQVGHPEFFGRGLQILEEVKNEIPEAQLIQLYKRSREEVREWYNKAHVLLHLVENQGGWLVPLEAICAGLPVVTTQRFSPSSMIIRNKLGIVTMDPSEAILLKKHEALDIEKSREWVRDNLTWEIYGQKILEITKG